MRYDCSCDRVLFERAMLPIKRAALAALAGNSEVGRKTLATEKRGARHMHLLSVVLLELVTFYSAQKVSKH